MRRSVDPAAATLAAVDSAVANIFFASASVTPLLIRILIFSASVNVVVTRAEVASWAESDFKAVSTSLKLLEPCIPRIFNCEKYIQGSKKHLVIL